MMGSALMRQIPLPREVVGRALTREAEWAARGRALVGSRKSRSATNKGDSHESFISYALQSAPHHLSFLRIGRARLFGSRHRAVRLRRIAAVRLYDGDL